MGLHWVMERRKEGLSAAAAPAWISQQKGWLLCLFSTNISTNLNIQLGLQILYISKVESFLQFTLAKVKEVQTKQTNKNSMGEPSWGADSP